MRTNIDIDDELMTKAMSAGPYSTKKDAVEAGLKLLARQAAYREVLKWEGKLRWEGDEASDWTTDTPSGGLMVSQPVPPPYRARTEPQPESKPRATPQAQPPKGAKRGRR